MLRAIFAHQRRQARLLGENPSRASSNGAVTFVQRFNSALEISLHFHSLIPDGVFVRDGRDPDVRPRFVELDRPTDDDITALLDRIITRIVQWLARRGRLDDDALDHEPEPLLLLATRPAKRHAEPLFDEKLPRLCARKDGFSLHAGVAVHENDRQGLERLARYGLRPAFALERLTEADDGTLRYQMKRRFSDGRYVLTFTPRELVLRLCALVPPRRFHSTRYAGIFSAHARGRYALTGRGLHDEPLVPTPTPPPSAAPTSALAPRHVRLGPEAPATVLPSARADDDSIMPALRNGSGRATVASKCPRSWAPTTRAATMTPRLGHADEARVRDGRLALPTMLRFHALGRPHRRGARRRAHPSAPRPARQSPTARQTLAAAAATARLRARLARCGPRLTSANGSAPTRMQTPRSRRHPSTHTPFERLHTHPIPAPC